LGSTRNDEEPPGGLPRGALHGGAADDAAGPAWRGPRQGREVARAKVVQLAQRAGLRLKQTFEREGRSLRRRAGGYAHAKQFKRLRRVLKRQRTVLGRVLRDVQRRLLEAPQDVRDRLQPWLERAERIRSQRHKDKHKLYALHAPEVECIGKGSGAG